jgi:spermidine synthase
MTLSRRGDEYIIRLDGKDLMGSRMKGSEQALAILGCDRAKTRAAAKVLVGGLGLGFTLRAALDVLAPDATVIVSELMPIVLEWNKGPLGPLAGHPLDDPRVRVEIGDVGDHLRKSPATYDALLLDIDNGPAAFTQASNANLYDEAGLRASRASLRPGGVYAVWGAADDRTFERRMRKHGFQPETHHVRGRGKEGGPRHTIFVGRI